MKRIFSHSIAALAAGFGLRLYFVLRVPAGSGDTILYEEIATNWLKRHAYALLVDGHITPVDLRMPGYPGFLALLYALTGRTGADAHLAVMLAQVAVDLLTCVVVAALAALIAIQVPISDPEKVKNRAFCAALWLAALCPFTANYTAVVMTEICALFWTALACLFFVWLMNLLLRSEGSQKTSVIADLSSPRKQITLSILAGLSVGIGTLFRPESPLLLISAWIVLLALAWLRPSLSHSWAHMIRLCVISGIACVLPLLPWAVRNAITLHEVQFLTPKNSNLPGEVVPYGFMAWEKTWLYRMRDCYLVSWKLNDEAINVNDIPPRAFDSPDEKLRVSSILDEYNQSLNLTPAEDAAFGELARERSAHHPLRTYLWIPLERVVTIWFSPRIELLPFSGEVFPLARSWHDDPVDQSVTIALFLINIFYLALGLYGEFYLWRLAGAGRSSPAARAAIFFFATFILLRTIFLTTIETPEPRYVLLCFPAIIALAAQVFAHQCDA